jgi:hypothetical protein
MDHDPRSAGLDRLRYRQCGQDGEGAEKIFLGATPSLWASSFPGPSDGVLPLQRGYLITLNKNTVFCISGGVIMLVLNMIVDKGELKWVRNLSLFFTLFGGMLIAVVWP